MVSAGLGLLALLALSAGVWTQPLNSVTGDEDAPPTSCESDTDCGGREGRGRCIKNWPEKTNNEELARMMLPEFEASKFWPVCECNRLPTGKMPQGPRCEDERNPLVRTCNRDEQCGDGRCLFWEDGFGYCICPRDKRGDRCQNSGRVGEQVLGGQYFPGSWGGIYGGGGFYGGYPNNMLGYQTGYGLYNGNKPYYNNGGYGGYYGASQPYYGGYYRGAQPYYNGGLYGYGGYNGAYRYGAAYQAPFRYGGAYGGLYGAQPYAGYYGNGYGAAYNLGYQAPYRYGAGYALQPYAGYYGSGYNLGYQAPFNLGGAYALQQPFTGYRNVAAYQAPYRYYGTGAQVGYQAPYGGYYGNYGAFQPRFGNMFQPGYFRSNLAYQPGVFNQPYYQAGYQLPFNGGYRGVPALGGFQAAPYMNYAHPYMNYAQGAQFLPRTTYYQNYQLPAFQLPAYRPATTYYQPYVGSPPYSGIPWSLYALTYSTGQPSFPGYQPYFGGNLGYNYGGYGGYPGYNLGYNYGAGYGAAWPGYGYGGAFPGYNYGRGWPAYGAAFPGYNYGGFPGYNYGAMPAYNYSPRYNYGGYYPRYNYGALPAYNLGYGGFPRYNFGAAASPYWSGGYYGGYSRYFGYQAPFYGGYYGNMVGYQPGVNYRPGAVRSNIYSTNNPPYSLYALQLLMNAGQRFGEVYPGYPGAIGAAFPGYYPGWGGAIPGYGTPYYTGIVSAPAYGIPGRAPYSFYGPGMIGGAFPGGVYGGYPVGLAPGAGYVPGGGFVPGGYRPGAAYPVGWTPTPGSGGAGTGTVPAGVGGTGGLYPGGLYGGYGPYVRDYGFGYAPGAYGYGLTGRLLSFNKLTGNYAPSDVPYAAAMGGAAIGASPVPGAGPMGGDAAAVASGGASLMANLGKAGGWEPTFMPEICDTRHPSGGFCQNGGVCHNNMPNGVTCECPPGWMGRACETEKGARGLAVQTPFTFGCGCPVAVNGRDGQVVTTGGQPIPPGECINPCVMTSIDRLRIMGGNGGLNPAFNSNNQPDLFPSVETGPAGFLQCGDRNHPGGNCHFQRCAPGTIFSFGAQVCTTDDVGVNTPPGVGVPPIAPGAPVVPGAPAVGNAFVGGMGNPFFQGPGPFKKK